MFVRSIVATSLFFLASIFPSTAQTGVSVSPINSTRLYQPKYLYSTASSQNLVYEYLIDPSTGVITPTSQQTASTGSQPGRAASDAGGFRLYVADTGSNELSAYFINRSNGSLQPVPGSPVAVDGYPSGVAVHPSGDYVYVTASSNDVTAFAVQQDGSLVSVPGSPFPTQSNPVALVIDPTGRFLYVTDLTADWVDAYAIDTATGALTPIHGEPYDPPARHKSATGCYPVPPGIGSAAFDLAIEPSGHFLLVPGLCDGQIVRYRINSTTGALTNTAGSPLVDPRPNQNQPVDITSISVDPLNRWMYFYESFPGEIPGGDLATFTKRQEAERTGSQCGDLVRADFVYALQHYRQFGLRRVSWSDSRVFRRSIQAILPGG
jgi:6-phosphogluconolactonase